MTDIKERLQIVAINNERLISDERRRQADDEEEVLASMKAKIDALRFAQEAVKIMDIEMISILEEKVITSEEMQKRIAAYRNKEIQQQRHRIEVLRGFYTMNRMKPQKKVRCQWLQHKKNSKQLGRKLSMTSK